MCVSLGDGSKSVDEADLIHEVGGFNFTRLKYKLFIIKKHVQIITPAFYDTYYCISVLSIAVNGQHIKYSIIFFAQNCM